MCVYRFFFIKVYKGGDKDVFSHFHFLFLVIFCLSVAVYYPVCSAGLLPLLFSALSLSPPLPRFLLGNSFLQPSPFLDSFPLSLSHLGEKMKVIRVK